jgi:CarD family transcriptional regulator
MKTEFKAGDPVVYPMHGVGKIDKVEEKDILGKKQLYYILKLSVSDMTAMIPVEKSESLGLRPCANKKMIEDALNILQENPENIDEDWKSRYNINHNLIKKGSLLELSQVVRNLYHRNRVKELSNTEKKLFEYALQLMIDEISASKGQEKLDVEDLITRQLEQSAV